MPSRPRPAHALSSLMPHSPVRTMPPILPSLALSPGFQLPSRWSHRSFCQALQWDTWQPVDPKTCSQPLGLGHYGMVQRWLVVYSQAAFERAEATLKKATQRGDETIKKQLLHLQAQRFGTPQAAHEALGALAQDWQSHRVASSQLTDISATPAQAVPHGARHARPGVANPGPRPGK